MKGILTRQIWIRQGFPFSVRLLFLCAAPGEGVEEVMRLGVLLLYISAAVYNCINNL